MNGGSPSIISIAQMPSDQTSTRVSYGRLRTISARGGERSGDGGGGGGGGGDAPGGIQYVVPRMVRSVWSTWPA